MIVGLGLGIAASSHFVVTAAAEVIRKKIGVTAIGNAQIDTAQSKFGGSSALFDGSGDYLTISQGQSLTDYTVEFWYRANTLPGSGLTPFINFGNTLFYIGYVGANTVYDVFSNSGSRVTLNTVAISTGTWYHYAAVRSGSTIKVYHNGTEVTSGTWSVAVNWDSATADIGKYSSYYWNGWFDEVRISNTARYTANFTPQTTPFVNDENTLLLLHMDGTDASTVFEDDNGVRSKKGLRAINQAQIDTAQSKFGGASALFDGTGDYLQTSTSSDFLFGAETNSFTIEFWMRSASFAAVQIPISNRTGGTGASKWWCEIPSVAPYTGKMYWAFYNSAGTPTYVNLAYAGTAFSTNTWYHIALVNNGGTARMYVNGTQVGADATLSGTYGSDALPIYVAGLGGSLNFNGHLDEVRISNTARYTANFTAPTAPFVNDANTLLLIHADGTDGSTYFEDDTGVSTPGRQQKHVSYINNAQLDTAQSKFGGSSLLLDGVNDYLLISSGSEFGFGTGDFTAEAWIYPTSVSGDRAIFEFRNTGTTTNFVLFVSGGNFGMFAGGATRIITTGAPVTANTWHHVAISRSSGSTKLFLNGSQAGSTYSDSTNYPNENLIIGVDYTTAADFIGNIDEVRVSNTARYTANFTPSTTPFQDDANTLLLLHFDGADASTVFVDDVGVRAKIGITAIGNAQIDTAQSKFGGASALFDGTGDKLTSPTDISLNSSYWTVEYWIRINSQAGSYTNTIGIWTDNASSATEWYFTCNAFSGTGKMGFQYLNTSGTNSGQIAFGSSLATGAWQHHAFVNNNGTVTAYLNGVSQGTHTLNGSVRSGQSNPVLKIGGLDAAGYFNGHLDEIRISNTARYTANFTAPTEPFQNDSNTLLLLHMDGTDGSTVFTDDNGVPPDYNYGA